MSYREFVNKAIGKSLSSFHRTFIGLEAIESNNKVQDLNLDRILAIAKDGTIELSANGFSITLDKATSGQAEVSRVEGSTLVNFSKIEEERNITNKYDDIVGNGKALDTIDNEVISLGEIVGNTMVNYSNVKDATPSTSYDTIIGNEGQIPTVEGEIIRPTEIIGNTALNLSKTKELTPVTYKFNDIVEMNRGNLEGAIDGTLEIESIEGNTLHNLSSIKDSTPVTHKFADIIGNEGILEGAIDGTCEVGQIIGDTLVNLCNIGNEPITHAYEDVIEGNEGQLPTVEGEHICVDNVIGDTLVNLCDNWDEGRSPQFPYVITENTRLWYGSNLVNTTNEYTLVIRVSKNTSTEVVPLLSGYENKLKASKNLEVGEIGTFSIKFTCNDSSIPIRLSSVYCPNGEVVVDYIMILEGDYTNKPIPQEVFEGLQSSFEDGLVTDENDENYGKYKVEIRADEDTQTLYLNSPLLKGDKLVNKADGVYHVHNMGKIVLDGSEDEGWGGSKIENSCVRMAIYKLAKYDSFIICDKFTANINTYYNNEEGIIIDGGGILYLGISINKLSTPDVTGFKQWLQANPTTIAYELATPWEEKVLDHRLTLECPNNGNISVNSNIPVQSYGFTNLSNSIDLLQPNKQYTLQIECDKDITTKFTFLGEVNENYTLNKGFNKILFTTPSTITNRDIVFEGKEGIISTVLLEGDYTEKSNLEYFEGIQSSYECERSKNLFDKTKLINYDDNHKFSDYISVKPNTSYCISGRPIFNLNAPITATRFCYYYDINKQLISSENTNNPRTPENCYYMHIVLRVDNKDKPGEFTDDLNLIQLEEGTVPTEYEPYGYKAEVKAYNPYNATDLIAKLKGGANQ